MKNMQRLYGKLGKCFLTASVAVASIITAEVVSAGPPAQSGPNVSRFDTQAWFYYSTQEHIVFHSRDVVQQCINAFNANAPAPVLLTGTWGVQAVGNPRDSGLVNVIAKAGEDVETWVFPLEYFGDENGPYSDLQVCINLLFPFGWPQNPDPHPEIATGIAHVIGRDNNVNGVETKRRNSWGLSSHGLLHSSDPEGKEVLFNGGFHCVATEDPADPKCTVRISLQE